MAEYWHSNGAARLDVLISPPLLPGSLFPRAIPLQLQTYVPSVLSSVGREFIELLPGFQFEE